MLTCCVTLCEIQTLSEPHFHCLNNWAEILPISQVGQRASREARVMWWPQQPCPQQSSLAWAT